MYCKWKHEKMRGDQSKRRDFKLLAVGTKGWRGWQDVHRGKSWGHPHFGLVPSAKPRLSSLLLYPLCNQEGTFWLGTPGEEVFPGRATSQGFVWGAHLHAAGSSDGPCFNFQPSKQCPMVPKCHQTDRAHARHNALPAMTISKSGLAPRASPYVTALGNLARTSGVIKPVQGTM